MFYILVAKERYLVVKLGSVIVPCELLDEVREVLSKKTERYLLVERGGVIVPCEVSEVLS